MMFLKSIGGSAASGDRHITAYIWIIRNSKLQGARDAVDYSDVSILKRRYILSFLDDLRKFYVVF